MREAMDGAHEFAIHGAISPVSILPWYIQFTMSSVEKTTSDLIWS